jgi:hypothetical protein
VERPGSEELEDVFDGFAGSSEDFAGAFDGADSNVLTGSGCAFAQVGGSVDGVKGGEVGGGFACAFGGAGYALTRSFADVARAAAQVVFSAGVLFVFFGRMGAGHDAAERHEEKKIGELQLAASVLFPS